MPIMSVSVSPFRPEAKSIICHSRLTISKAGGQYISRLMLKGAVRDVRDFEKQDQPSTESLLYLAALTYTLTDRDSCVTSVL